MGIAIELKKSKEQETFIFPIDVTTRNNWISAFPNPDPEKHEIAIIYARKDVVLQPYQSIVCIKYSRVTDAGYVQINCNELGVPTSTGSVIHESSGAVYEVTKIFENV